MIFLKLKNLKDKSCDTVMFLAKINAVAYLHNLKTKMDKFGNIFLINETSFIFHY